MVRYQLPAFECAKMHLYHLDRTLDGPLASGTELWDQNLLVKQLLEEVKFSRLSHFSQKPNGANRQIKVNGARDGNSTSTSKHICRSDAGVQGDWMMFLCKSENKACWCESWRTWGGRGLCN